MEAYSSVAPIQSVIVIVVKSNRVSESFEVLK